jgi:hypothetical protein
MHDVSAEQTRADEIDALLEEYHVAKEATVTKLAALEIDIKANEKDLDVNKSKYLENTQTLQTREAELKACLKEKNLLDLEKEDAEATQKDCISDNTLKGKGCKILQEALEVLGQHKGSIDNYYLYHDWYLPKGYDFEKITPYMDWNDSFKGDWRARFRECREQHKGYEIFSTANYVPGEKENSYHYKLESMVRDRLAELKRLKTDAETDEAQAIVDIQAKKALLEEKEKECQSKRVLKIEAEKLKESSLERVAGLTTLLQKQREETAFLQANDRLLEYQILLLPLKSTLDEYSTVLKSIEGKDTDGETDEKIIVLGAAVRALSAIKKRYTENVCESLKRANSQVTTEAFLPVLSDEGTKRDALEVTDELKRHVENIDKVTIELNKIKIVESGMRDRAKKEKIARDKRRIHLVNACLDEKERVDEGENADKDLSPWGALSSYLFQRAHYYAFKDWCANIFKRVLSCFITIKTDKEKRQEIVDEQIKPALRTYQKTGDKEELMDTITPLRHSIKSRAKENRTGYGQTLQFFLTKTIDEMPGKNDIVEDTATYSSPTL